MPITRTPMIDDDGSGTTGTILNNAWKQGLYDQIDAAGQGPQFTFIPTSPQLGSLQSGGDLGVYSRLGNWIFLSTRLLWPVNADAANIATFLLPVPQQNSIDGGLVQSYGPRDCRWWIPNNAPQCNVLNAVTGAPFTNADLSGQLFIVHGLYFAS
jgi:hypothetical protein